MRALLLALLTSCTATDVFLDRVADDPRDCCWLWPASGEVEACFQDSADWTTINVDDRGCVLLTCHPSTVRAELYICPAE